MADRPLGRSILRFVYELSRRRVFRVFLLYTVFGAGAAEGAYLFLPALGFPAYAFNLVAILVVLGLPVAVGLAWAFDVVPDQSTISPETDGSAAPVKDTVPTDRTPVPVEDAAEHWTPLADPEVESVLRDVEQPITGLESLTSVESLPDYQEGVRLARQAGRADDLALAVGLQADALIAAGKAADAIPLYEEAADILSELATDKPLFDAVCKLAHAHEAGGRADDASAAWGLAKETGVMLNDEAGASEAAEHEARLQGGDSQTSGEASS
jgi:hypothetical protein